MGYGTAAARPQDTEKAVTTKQNVPDPNKVAAPGSASIAVEPGRNRDNPNVPDPNKVAAPGSASIAVEPGRNRDNPNVPDPNKVAAPGSASIAVEPGRNRDNPPVSNVRLGMNSSRVLWARLNAAASNVRLDAEAHAAARGRYDEARAARGEFEALSAELNTCADDLSDEVDLLKAQLKIREADVQASKVQQAKAAESLKSVQMLAERNGVGKNEVSLSLSDVDLRSAELAAKQAELDEVALRIKQATRRRDEAIALAKRANGLVHELEAVPGPAAPAANR